MDNFGLIFIIFLKSCIASSKSPELNFEIALFSKEEIIQWKNQNNKFDVLLISTNQGILTHQEALNLNIGGEVMISIS